MCISRKIYAKNISFQIIGVISQLSILLGRRWNKRILKLPFQNPDRIYAWICFPIFKVTTLWSNFVKRFETGLYQTFLKKIAVPLFFLVGAFSLKEKARLLQWVVFFLFQPTISLWMVHFLQFVHLFCCSSSTKFLKPESGGSILALNHNILYFQTYSRWDQRVPPLGFFGTMRLFFENFRILSKGNPLHFFEVFGL